MFPTLRRFARLGALLGLVGLVGSTGAAHAVPFDNRPKILLHLKPATTKNACTTYGDLPDCRQAVTRGDVNGSSGPFYFAYLLVATGPLRDTALGGNGEGIAGLQCGIDYDGCPSSGVDIFAWNLCATLEFAQPDWPAAGSGNLITWDSTSRCQKGEVAIAGYFYCGAYSPDTFHLLPRPVDSQTKVATCAASELNLGYNDLGSASFGNAYGCNPCNDYCGVTDFRRNAVAAAPAPPVVAPACGAIRLRFPSLGVCGYWSIYRDGAFLSTASGAATGFVDANPGDASRCYSLVVVSPGSTSARSGEACATAAAPPHPTAIDPSGAAPGDTVEIHGFGFGSPDTETDAVHFWGAEEVIATDSILAWGDDLIRCLVPVGAHSGPVSVRNACGESLPLSFTPVVVSNLLATESDDGVLLTWDAVDDGRAIGFNVYRRSAGSARMRLNAAPLAVAPHNLFVDFDIVAPGRCVYSLEELQRSGGARPLGEIALDFVGRISAPGIAAIRPNPARADVTIAYRLQSNAAIRLELFDVQGRPLVTLVEGAVEAGRHTIVWDGRTADGRRAAPGMYVVRLSGAGVLASEKLILAR